MSLLYSILKPIVRKIVKGSSVHREESYEEFKQLSYKEQSKFRFELPKIIMYFAGDEVFAGIAPDFEKSFRRCGVKDYEIRIKPGMPHAWPVFTFLKEGREGEQEIIGDINSFFGNK